MTGARPDVLLIDDSLVDLRLLMELMTLRDLRFAVGREAERGYEQAVVLRPALILLDVRMPRMDGFTVCRRLKANPVTRDIPVIFLTAATDIEERLAGFAAGGVDFICKPFEPREVLARVGVHLELATRRIDENRDATPQEPISAEVAVTTKDQVIVATAQKILRDQLVSPPSLEELARLVGVNRRRLNDAFQGFLGQPVFGWLREERLRQAHALVFQSDTSISVISDCLGYSTPANFTKAFRDRYGITPTELRISRPKLAAKSG